jgi:nitrogen fixation protein
MRSLAVLCLPLSLALALACRPSSQVLYKDTVEEDSPDDTGGPDSGDSEDSEDSEPPPASVSLGVAPAFDPILGGPLPLDAEVVGEGDLRIEVQDAKGTVLATPTGSWDGRDAKGARLPVGPYRIVARLLRGAETLAEDVDETRIVRCGFLDAYAEDDGGTSATLVPMFWFRDRVVQDLDEPFVSLDAMEDAGGAATHFQAVTDELETFPSDANLPLATTVGSRPILTLVLGDASILGASGLVGAGIGLSVPGWTVLSGVPLAPGTPVVLQADSAISETLGVVEEEVSLGFVVEAEGSTWNVGTQTLPIRWNVLLGEPTFTRTESQYTAWAAGVEPALRAIDGTAAEHDAVLNALVEWVFYDHGLSYDTRSGASYYTRGGWSSSTFMAGPFLERAWGSIVNCSDCAGIMAFYANQIGADLNMIIVLQNFQLNQILAIGGTGFSNCPFGPYSCGFSYHAVTTDDGGGTIWDATLALDGDSDPSSLPGEVLLVQTIDGEEYLDRLVMSGSAWYQYESKGMIQ